MATILNFVSPNFLIFVPPRISGTHFASPGVPLPLDVPGSHPVLRSLSYVNACDTMHSDGMAVLKIVATRGEIFNLKFTKYCLAAGLRPDPLGELKRSPRPPSRNKGALLLRGRGREGEEGRGEEGKGRGRGREREVEFPHLFNPTLTTVCQPY